MAFEPAATSLCQHPLEDVSPGVVGGGPLCTQHSSCRCGPLICPTYLCHCCVGWGGRESALAPQVSTAEDNGILLYNGDNDHIAVELYQGHVRVSYDPGSYPSSAIYR